MNDEKIKSNLKGFIMLSLIIHYSSLIIYLRPPQKLLINF